MAYQHLKGTAPGSVISVIPTKGETSAGLEKRKDEREGKR